jgi:short-subunit dehydrogenase
MAVPTWQWTERYGPWAVVAGASEGLGAAFAEALAARGLNVVIVARRAEPLNALVAGIRTRHGVQTRAIALDLSLIGPFLDQPLDGHLRELEVNCRSPLAAVHGFGQGMVRRGHGGIILMSSLSGLQGTALVAHYAATKAWNRVLAEGLWWELGKRGVDVLACVAGATDTPGYRASAPNPREAGKVPVMNVEAVVEEALSALGRTPSIVTGMRNRWAAGFLVRLLPRRMAVRIMGKAMDSLYGPG